MEMKCSNGALFRAHPVRSIASGRNQGGTAGRKGLCARVNLEAE